MPTYLWKCKECLDEVRIFRSMKDYKEPPSEGECDSCNQDTGHVWEKQIENPMVFKESYVDGQRMKTDQSYSEYAKALDIDSKLQNYRRTSEEYKEMKKESAKLKGKDVGEATRSAGSGKTRKGT